MKDHASFDREALLAVFGRPQCPFCGSFDIEFHHIKGRGGKYDRRVHASVFNAFPLSANCHAHAPLHDPEIEAWFLRVADEKVRYAVARGDYVLTIRDKQFREKFPL